MAPYRVFRPRVAEDAADDGRISDEETTDSDGEASSDDEGAATAELGGAAIAQVANEGQDEVTEARGADQAGPRVRNRQRPTRRERLSFSWVAGRGRKD